MNIDAGTIVYDGRIALRPRVGTDDRNNDSHVPVSRYTVGSKEGQDILLNLQIEVYLDLVQFEFCKGRRGT